MSAFDVELDKQNDFAIKSWRNPRLGLIKTKINIELIGDVFDEFGC